MQVGLAVPLGPKDGFGLKRCLGLGRVAGVLDPYNEEKLNISYPLGTVLCP